jgi:hypothetical protein
MPLLIERTMAASNRQPPYSAAGDCAAAVSDATASAGVNKFNLVQQTAVSDEMDYQLPEVQAHTRDSTARARQIKSAKTLHLFSRRKKTDAEYNNRGDDWLNCDEKLRIFGVGTFKKSREDHQTASYGKCAL